MILESDIDRRHTVGEYTDRAGAEVLKARIEAYWRERGYEVLVTLVQAAFSPAVRAARYDVRSELTNGLPRAQSKSRAAQRLV